MPIRTFPGSMKKIKISKCLLKWSIRFGMDYLKGTEEADHSNSKSMSALAQPTIPSFVSIRCPFRTRRHSVQFKEDTGLFCNLNLRLLDRWSLLNFFFPMKECFFKSLRSTTVQRVEINFMLDRFSHDLTVCPETCPRGSISM